MLIEYERNMVLNAELPKETNQEDPAGDIYVHFMIIFY